MPLEPLTTIQGPARVVVHGLEVIIPAQQKMVFRGEFLPSWGLQLPPALWPPEVQQQIRQRAVLAALEAMLTEWKRWIPPPTKAPGLPTAAPRNVTPDAASMPPPAAEVDRPVARPEPAPAPRTNYCADCGQPLGLRDEPPLC